MAVVVAIKNRSVPGARYEEQVELSFSANNDYAANGIAITAALLGLQRLDFFLPIAIGPSLAAGIFNYSWDYANQKLKLYTDGGVEVADGADISTIKIYALVKGL